MRGNCSVVAAGHINHLVIVPKIKNLYHVYVVYNITPILQCTYKYKDKYNKNLPVQTIIIKGDEKKNRF